jgi:hypothetical protein
MFVFSSSELTLEAEVGGGVHDNRGESHNVPKRLNAVTEGEQRSGVVLTVKRRETSLTEIFNFQSFTFPLGLYPKSFAYSDQLVASFKYCTEVKPCCGIF